MEYFKWSLMSHPTSNMEDFVAMSDLNCEDLSVAFFRSLVSVNLMFSWAWWLRAALVQAL